MDGVLYLDIDDEITSAVARIRTAPVGPVVLVVPYGSRLASSRINFRLLAREAAALQRGLTIVAPEPATRALAASAGLATHATVLEFEAVAARAAAGPSAPQVAGPPLAVAGPPLAPTGPPLAATGPAFPMAPAPPGPASSPAGGSAGVVRGVRAGGSARGWSQLSLDDTPGGGEALAKTVVAPTAGALPDPGDQSAGPSIRPPQPPVVILPPRDAAQYLRGPMPAPSIPSIGPPPGRAVSRARILVILVVLALVASVAGVAATTLLPSVAITLRPVTEIMGPIAMTVTADPAVTTSDPDRLLIPATRLSVPVSVNAKFAATGKELIEQKAAGAVTFQNCDTGGAHTFPSGALVKTADGTAFTTQSSLKLDRAKINPAFTCTAGTINVTAVKAGPEANTVAGTITQLPAGFDPIVLSVVNRAATAGGSRTELIRIVKADVDSALAQLRANLAQAFAAKLAEPAITPVGAVLLAQSQRLGEAAPSADPNTLIGLAQATFDLGLAATGAVLAVDPGPVTAVAEARLASSVPPGYRLVTGSSRATVDPPVLAGEVITFAVRIRAERSRVLDVAGLLNQVRGKSIAAARTILEPYGQVGIDVWPDWVTAIPDSDSRVRLMVAAVTPPGATPGPSVAPVASPTTRPSTLPSPARTSSLVPATPTRRP